MMQYCYCLNLFAPWKADDVEQVVCIMLRDSHHLPIDCLHIHRSLHIITSPQKKIKFALPGCLDPVGGGESSCSCGGVSSS